MQGYIEKAKTVLIFVLVFGIASFALGVRYGHNQAKAVSAQVKVETSALK